MDTNIPQYWALELKVLLNVHYTMIGYLKTLGWSLIRTWSSINIHCLVHGIVCQWLICITGERLYKLNACRIEFCKLEKPNTAEFQGSLAIFFTNIIYSQIHLIPISNNAEKVHLVQLGNRRLWLGKIHILPGTKQKNYNKQPWGLNDQKSV